MYETLSKAFILQQMGIQGKLSYIFENIHSTCIHNHWPLQTPTNPGPVFRFRMKIRLSFKMNNFWTKVHLAPTKPLLGARALPEKCHGNQHFKSVPAGLVENPISVALQSYQFDWQRIYNLSTRFQQTLASYTPRIPSVRSDNVSSVTRVTLANQRTGRQKSYIKAESVLSPNCSLSTVLFSVYTYST